MNRHPRWVIGLVILAAIVAHDLLMASSVHAADVQNSAPGQESLHSSQRSPVHGGSSVAAAIPMSPGLDLPLPSHGCSVIRYVAPPVDSNLKVTAAIVLGVFAPDEAVPQPSPRAHGIFGQPPAVKRALLQVYRI